MIAASLDGSARPIHDASVMGHSMSIQTPTSHQPWNGWRSADTKAPVMTRLLPNLLRPYVKSRTGVLLPSVVDAKSPT
jgi:hypothetical protein